MQNVSGARPPMTSVGAAQTEELARLAAASPRKRSHLLLHAGPDDPVQRLLIAAEPGTYVRPHWHSEQWEMLVWQRGRMEILIFGAETDMITRVALDDAHPVLQIQPGTVHGCIVTQPGTLVLEVKPGPYRPNEFVDWAPEEGHASAGGLLHWMVSAEAGQRWRSK